MSKIVIAFYDKAEQARQIGQELAPLGLSPGDISVLGGRGGSDEQGLLKSGASGPDFIKELGQFGVSQDEAHLYAQGLQHGGGLVIARIDDRKAEQTASIMERQPVIDIESRAQQWRTEGGEQSQKPQRQEGQTVQSVEEELQVGKRETQGGRVRIHTHIEEKPVEERIRLRQEELDVQRKKADRKLSPEEAEKALQERTVEVSATREQPVVSKQARVVEEVSVGKSQSEREEVIRDTVRKTKLDVEQEDVEKQGS